MEVKSKTLMEIGVFIAIASALLIPTILPEDKIYFCDDTELAGYCYKLSKQNSNDLSTRCYYNESALTNFKVCKTGWYPFPYRDLNLDDYINREEVPQIIPEEIPAPAGIASNFGDFNQIKGNLNKENCTQVNCTQFWG